MCRDSFAPSNIEYHITYTLRDALNPNQGTDELYWNNTGTWPVVITNSQTTVNLPSGKFLDVNCYQGYDQETSEPCLADTSGSTATFVAKNLAANEQVTISGIFP